MSPKFYAFLWIIFAISAVILWLGGVFDLTMIVLYGFIAFGIVFTGMMCVLPGMVSHPPAKKAKTKSPKGSQPVFRPVSVSTGKQLDAKLRFQ